MNDKLQFEKLHFIQVFTRPGWEHKSIDYLSTAIEN
jgi:hypothetical protein